jgi:hypothetical protein
MVTQKARKILQIIGDLDRPQYYGARRQGAMLYPTVAVHRVRGWVIEYNSGGGAEAYEIRGPRPRQVSYYLRDDGQIYSESMAGRGLIDPVVIRDFKTLSDKGLVVGGPSGFGSLIGSLGAHHSKHHRQG